jgi:prevent-host-death family protein
VRTIRSSDAKARLSELLDDVERGQTLVITRHGRAVARLVPEGDEAHAETLRAMERIEAFRQTMPRLSLSEILSARHQGHRL